jgi:CheY-like chemotaxis protein
MTAQSNLAGIRVLIVEDEPLISLFIEDTLTDIGCSTVAVAANLADATTKVQRVEWDVVLLDVNLHGVQSFGLAETLSEKKRPVVFSTGYGIAGIPAHLQHIPVLQKPFQERELIEKLQLALKFAESYDLSQRAR